MFCADCKVTDWFVPYRLLDISEHKAVLYGYGGHMKIQNRLAELVAIKARKENKPRITQREIRESTGVSLDTINRWINNKARQYDVRTIALFCDYLQCTTGDLFVLVDEDGNIVSLEDERQLVA